MSSDKSKEEQKREIDLNRLGKAAPRPGKGVKPPPKPEKKTSRGNLSSKGNSSSKEYLADSESSKTAVDKKKPRTASKSRGTTAAPKRKSGLAESKSLPTNVVETKNLHEQPASNSPNNEKPNEVINKVLTSSLFQNTKNN